MKPSPSPFENIALMADPIHGYVSFTVQSPAQTTSEQTEQDLIDSPWIQRLRYILQLQSARWVYPGAEHTRFQHSIGTMHLAGRFMLRLYPSLKEIIPDLPSLYFMEELARLTALLHDIGHGPFCHFFDHHHLDQFGITHEQIGQRIIVEDLSSIIKNIRRSPSGPFASGESMDPSFLAFLILKNPQKSIKGLPRWLTFLQPLLGG
ncbi:MAG: HD domain-containing protein, partial [Nitrospira sp.]|nr:HD domain-containing protein [Nitrospira sp.]